LSAKPDNAFLFLQRRFVIIRTTNSRKRRRTLGYVVHVAPSRSAGFWCVLKDESNTPYFAYARSFLDCRNAPNVGWQVEFTPLPRGPGRLRRATEIAILPGPSAPRPERVVVRRTADGGLHIVLRKSKYSEVTIADLLLTELV
jgi:hypothetical protein